ncbi:MAG: hypothetical protein C0467_18765 [Planctomycetaceae bacterium]|nr:hypothetical protein [Planctomycetaceae bacterium]
MKLTEHRLQELSKIEVRYFTGPSSEKPYLEILVIKYIGVYGFGSGGNADARYMRAMVRAGIDAFEPWGVVHDLSELSYEWGDMLDQVFIGPDVEHSVMAVVVGPNCEEAVRTLCLGERSTEPLEKIGWVFRDLETAWTYVDSQIA